MAGNRSKSEAFETFKAKETEVPKGILPIHQCAVQPNPNSAEEREKVKTEREREREERE
jgi:hypothetical protein